MIRVLISEIHRILSARNLLLATIVGALWYLGLCWPQIEYLDDNEPNIHRVALDLTTRYGPTLEPDEFIGVQADLVRLTAEADSLVAAQPDLAAAGLHTFADVHSRGDLDTATSGLIWQVLLDDDGVGWRVQAYQGVVASYHDAETTLYANWSEPTVPVAQRIDKIIDAREWRSIQSAALLEQGGTYLEKVAILVVVVVLLLVGPLVTGDRATRVRALQATTRTGRRTLAIQLAATLLVSALTAIAVGILSGLALARFGLFSFWNNPIQSFLVGPSLYLWNLPLSGYAAVWLGLLALVGILAGHSASPPPASATAIPASASSSPSPPSCSASPSPHCSKQHSPFTPLSPSSTQHPEPGSGQPWRSPASVCWPRSRSPSPNAASTFNDAPQSLIETTSSAAMAPVPARATFP